MEKVAQNLSTVLMLAGMGMMLFMMLLGGADVIGRYFLNSPVVGAFEITEILLAGVVFFGLAYTQSVKGHVTVDLVYSRLPARLRNVVGMVNKIVLLCLFIMILWRGVATAIIEWKLHRKIPNLGLPYYPFQLFLPLGALAMCFVLIAEILQSFNAASEAD
jgi:TRAP-type C4-dicarboxylate transport system permease small subunit